MRLFVCSGYIGQPAALKDGLYKNRELGETLSGDFMSATDINHAMGRLYIAVAQGRIPIRNANTLARIGGTTLRSVKDVKTEFTFKYGFDQWKKMAQDAPPLSTPGAPEFGIESSSLDSDSANPPISIDSGAAPSANVTQPVAT